MNYLVYLSLIPSVLLGGYIYKNDKVEKEPTKLLLSCFISGILSGIVVIILSLFGIDYKMIPGNQISILFYSFIMVGLIEELAKFLFLYIITYKNKEFNYLYDSVVYASFIGLGFAIFENIFYIITTNDLLTILLRGVVTLPAHIFFGIFMGYYIGLSKKERIDNNQKIRLKYLLASLILPIILHGFFDYCLFTESDFSSILFLLFVLVLYLTSFSKIKELSAIKKSLYE